MMTSTPARVAAAALGLLAAAACSTDRLTVPNYNNPTPATIQADVAAAVPLLVNGILRNDAADAVGYVLGVGILGREVYNYTPTEGRNTSGWLTSDVNQSTSFGGVSNWTGPYTALRNITNLLSLVNGAPDAVLSAAQKNAVRGFAHTMEALALYHVISLRDDIGAVVTVDTNPTVLNPFVSRDSVYRYIVARLDLARTELSQGGNAFPFALHSGFAGFNTPVTFTRLNRALAARVNAYRASAGVGGCTARSATCYQTVLQNLAESFLDPAGSLTAGPVRVYSAAAGHVANTLSNAANANVLLHAKSDSGIPRKADGTPDNRFVAKVMTITRRNPPNPTLGVPTTFDFALYTARETPIAFIRNEELILLRAEARYFTGDLAGALADLNVIRTRAGGLAPLAAAPASADAFITELLDQRRLSLLFEGHRWIDNRRFGRLSTLTLDLPTHVVVSRLPVPQAECLARRIAGESLRPAQGCVGA